MEVVESTENSDRRELSNIEFSEIFIFWTYIKIILNFKYQNKLIHNTCFANSLIN